MFDIRWTKTKNFRLFFRYSQYDRNWNVWFWNFKCKKQNIQIRKLKLYKKINKPSARPRVRTSKIIFSFQEHIKILWLSDWWNKTVLLYKCDGFEEISGNLNCHKIKLASFSNFFLALSLSYWPITHVSEVKFFELWKYDFNLQLLNSITPRSSSPEKYRD